jgi:hypothetical protein
MNSVWGASLFKRFSEENNRDKQIPEEMFVKSILKYFKEGS